MSIPSQLNALMKIVLVWSYQTAVHGPVYHQQLQTMTLQWHIRWKFRTRRSLSAKLQALRPTYLRFLISLAGQNSRRGKNSGVTEETHTLLKMSV